MGDLRDWSPELNGAVTEDRPVPSSPLSSSNCNPNHTEIGADCWGRAEQATQEIISHVQPTVVSEKRRKEVIDYVQSLIRNRLGCEVFPFGSVPLKTYLPDGDIDLTAFGGLNVEDALVDDLRSVLEGEEQNWAAKFVVKDVQPIRAEVKLVKCLVQNIVVDISFNQLGGLCTLCFLEQVDRLIGKSNLFKRSIILIKAWCYYESRILGAHHGLISTYALETLVLYIFHLFHSSLCGPLAVLYKFLDYFSKFDWDNYCISLNGPVRISALPELLAEAPENGGNDLLLSNEFIKDSVDMFSVPSRGSETISRTFPAKHLNIIDPLKESNNLGRSVSKGNFYRIRSAFTYGARKLGHILSRPEESLADEIRKFFANTLDRHGKGQRPDVQEPMPLSPHNGCGPASPFSGIETSQADGSFSELESEELRGRSRQYRLDLEESSCNGIDNGKISGNGMECSQTLNESQRGFTRAIPSAVLLEAKSDANGTAFSGPHSGDVKDLATSRLGGLKISENTSKASSPRNEESMSPLGKGCHAPHFYFSHSYSGSAKMRDESPGWKQPENSDSAEDQGSMRVLPARDEERGIKLHHNQDEASGSRDDHLNSGSVGCSLDDFHPDYRERSSNGSAGSPEALNFLSNLSGDYENHISSLHYGRLCYDYAQSAPMPPPLLSQSQSKDPWGTVRWSGQLRQDVFPHMNANGFVPQAAFYAVSPVIPGAAFVIEEKPKPRGTGTYFPNTNHYRDRPSSSRGRNQAQVRSPRNNGRAVMPPETNLLERSSRELSQAQFPVHQSGGKPRLSDFPQSDFSGGTVFPSANGPILPAERVAELGSFVHPPSEGPSQESNGQQNTELSFAQSPHTSLPRPAIQRQKSVLGVNQDRIVAVQSYRLKDEDDFPPLSV